MTEFLGVFFYLYVESVRILMTQRSDLGDRSFSTRTFLFSFLILAQYLYGMHAL